MAPYPRRASGRLGDTRRRIFDPDRWASYVGLRTWSPRSCCAAIRLARGGQTTSVRWPLRRLGEVPSGVVEGPIGPPGERNGSQLGADAELLEDRLDL